MREKTNTIIECLLKVLLVTFITFMSLTVLYGIFAETILGILFQKMLFISLMASLGLFFVFLFFLMLFANSQSSYTVDLKDVTEEFEKIYKILYEKHIVHLEKIRNNIKKRELVVKILGGVFIICLFTSGYLATMFPEKGFLILFILIALAVVELFLYNANEKDNEVYKQTYKKRVIQDLINMLNYNVTYEIKNPNKIEYYRKKYIDAGFLSYNYAFYAENFIEGELENCPIKISNVTVMRQGHRRRTFFEGIFAYIDYNKYIMPNVVISGRFLFADKTNTKVNVNNELFNKYFNVYSQNKVYAENLLNSGFLEMLLNFRMKYNVDFDISLIDGKIYIKIYSFSIFEPEIFDKTNGKQDLYKHYCFAKFILDLIKEAKIIIDRN